MPVSLESLEDQGVVNTYRRFHSRSCSLCQKLRSGDPLTVNIHQQVYHGEISEKDAAVQLSVSYPFFNKHFKHHLPDELRQSAITAEAPKAIVEMAKEGFDILKSLEEKAQMLSKRFDIIAGLPPHPKTDFSIKAIASELRQYAMNIATLRGELTEAPLIQVQQTYLQMNELQMVVLENLCPACKQKLVERLEKKYPVPEAQLPDSKV